MERRLRYASATGESGSLCTITGPLRFCALDTIGISPITGKPNASSTASRLWRRVSKRVNRSARPVPMSNPTKPAMSARMVRLVPDPDGTATADSMLWRPEVGGPWPWSDESACESLLNWSVNASRWASVAVGGSAVIRALSSSARFCAAATWASYSVLALPSMLATSCLA